mgnify:CR=1 FL=1
MNHASQRLIERIVSQDTLDIVKESSTACYSKIGEYNLTQLVKSQITSKVESIKSMNFGNKGYGVLVHSFGKVVRTPDTNSESNGDSLAVGDKHLSTPSIGLLQIRRVMVDEINRILRKRNDTIRYFYSDRWSASKSIEMYYIWKEDNKKFVS